MSERKKLLTCPNCGNSCDWGVVRDDELIEPHYIACVMCEYKMMDMEYKATKKELAIMHNCRNYILRLSDMDFEKELIEETPNELQRSDKGVGV